jgi:hypothetical protein
VSPPPSSSLAEKERLRSLLLRAAARDSPTLTAVLELLAQSRGESAAVVGWPLQQTGERDAGIGEIVDVDSA